jgi:hypothetical protein
MDELWRWNGHGTHSGSRALEYDSRGEATDTSALCPIHFSFLFIEENCIPWDRIQFPKA